MQARVIANDTMEATIAHEPLVRRRGSPLPAFAGTSFAGMTVVEGPGWARAHLMAYTRPVCWRASSAIPAPASVMTEALTTGKRRGTLASEEYRSKSLLGRS